MLDFILHSNLSIVRLEIVFIFFTEIADFVINPHVQTIDEHEIIVLLNFFLRRLIV